MQVLEYKAKNKRTKETLLTCLADLFYRYRYRGRGEGSSKGGGGSERTTRE